MPNKTVLFLLMSLLLLTTGYSKNYIHSFILNQVDRTPPLENPPSPDPKGIYQDALIQIQWEPDPRGFQFKLRNLSSAKISIVWDECYIFDFVSKYQIVHNNIRDIREQPPSVLSPNDEISDSLYPAAYVPYRHGKYTGQRLREMYDPEVSEKTVTANEFTPRKFTLTLTISTDNESFKYQFYFITEAKPESTP